ncbi:hypothetical protein F5887DRAFT_1071390 [Amanita rubescens]|nr:hypothetical protein F5887DRAFT_1071390 [Amanita rubescens]
MVYRCGTCSRSFSSSHGRSNHERKCNITNNANWVLKFQAIQNAQRRKITLKPRVQARVNDQEHLDNNSSLQGGENQQIENDMDVDATTTSLQEPVDNYNLPPTRSGRKRRPPKRFRDEPPPPAPHVPAPIITATPDSQIPGVSPPQPSVQPPDLAACPTFQTEANSYGIYRSYASGRPSIYPLTQAATKMYQSPNFEETHNEERRPWWAVFSRSLEDVVENLYAPFKNATTFLLMYWQNTGENSKSNPEMDLLTEILLDPRFDVKDLRGFRAEREAKRLDAFSQSHIDTKSMFSPNDGWNEASVAVRLPCEGRKLKEDLAPCFDVGGVFFRKPLEVLKAALRGPTEHHMHWLPFQEYWRSNENAEPERVYSELYNSDAWIYEHDQLNDLFSRTAGPLPRMQAVIVGLMLWSDSTHLASFGTASLWPIYMFVGNQSKYIRSKTALLAAQHLAYIPKLPDTFQDFYRQVFGVSATSEVTTHCKRELIHLIWLLILDEEFMHAYVHGFDYVFYDGIRRLVFPRLFTYSADYPEKVLLACIRYLAKCPCPRCLVLKDDISEMGKKRDIVNRSKQARVDDITTQVRIAGARNAIFESGDSFNSNYIQLATGETSLTAVRSAFSTRFYEYGFNHYNMFVPDLLHEFELGVWKATFIHLMRILHANGNDSIQNLNKRYAPTYLPPHQT